MASSSLSQEDYEHDFELSSRRTRIRTARAANVRTAPLRTAGDAAAEDSENIAPNASIQGTTPTQADFDNVPLSSSIVDHDASPKPVPRTKDKRCARTNHINKGKVQRERRKLREKRRSTGVVHLQSTESTGGSTGEDDESLICPDTKKNTALNESISKEDIVEAPSQVKAAYPRQNKSPSDLDADDEEYDSTLNQSDSTVSLGGPGSEAANGQPVEVVAPSQPAGTGEPDSTLDVFRQAQQEILLLKQQSQEKDQRISILEAKLSSLTRELVFYDTQNKKLLEENRSLLNALAELKT